MCDRHVLVWAGCNYYIGWICKWMDGCMDEWVRYLPSPLQIYSDQLIATDPSDL